MSETKGPIGRTMRKTGNLRLARPPYTTTLGDRLQEEWQDVTNGGTEWIDVPVVVVSEGLSGRPRPIKA